HSQGLCGIRHDVATAHFCQPAWYSRLADQAGGLTLRQRLFSWLVTPLERWALTASSTRRGIAISERIRDDLDRHFDRRDGVRVVYHGVDLETFHPRNKRIHRSAVRDELGVGADECLALYVGNLQKGAAAAIRAVAEVPRTRLVLVSGSDTSADRAAA